MLHFGRFEPRLPRPRDHADRRPFGSDVRYRRARLRPGILDPGLLPPAGPGLRVFQRLPRRRRRGGDGDLHQQFKPRSGRNSVGRDELSGGRAGRRRGGLTHLSSCCRPRADAANRQSRDRDAAGDFPGGADLERLDLLCRHPVIGIMPGMFSLNLAAALEALPILARSAGQAGGGIYRFGLRILSALCLGDRNDGGLSPDRQDHRRKNGERHLTPAQGASTERIGGLLIGTAGLSGLPVSTTHIITSGVAGTMAASGAEPWCGKSCWPGWRRYQRRCPCQPDCSGFSPVGNRPRDSNNLYYFSAWLTRT